MQNILKNINEIKITKTHSYELTIIGNDASGGSDENDSVANDNVSVISNASEDSYMKDFEGKIYQYMYIASFRC